RIRTAGGEFGTTTGRPRRTGWIDLVALRYAARINGLTALAITKLDVLSGFETLPLCTAYVGDDESDGAEFTSFPYHQSVLHHVGAKYTEMPGWSEEISAARSEDELPEAVTNYLNFIEEFVGVPVIMVGVGPGHDQIIWRGDNGPPAA
ncbi:MAG: adenylosuccinate synthetase, partial [Solirubrobacterales bacterium]|nr:adenylosuccinate synthetase [Solirubrobacterales bacterium]